LAAGAGRHAKKGDRELKPRPTPTCCACILHERRLVMIQRAGAPNAGGWSFPGGHIELGETIFDAVTREVAEETGLEIEPLRVFQVYDWITRDDAGRVTFHYVVNYVRARYRSGEPRPGSDASDVRWVGKADITGLAMHPFVRQTAARLLCCPDAET